MKYDLAAKPASSIKNKTGSWRTYRPKISRDKCQACGICAQLCPEGIIYPNKKGKKNKSGKVYYDRDLNFCKGCGICAEECPFKAIEMVLEKK